MNTKLLTADGRPSAYGLACGYVDTFEAGSVETRLWSEHGVFHVRSHDFMEGKRIGWTAFNTFTKARKWFDHVKRSPRQHWAIPMMDPDPNEYQRASAWAERILTHGGNAPMATTPEAAREARIAARVQTALVCIARQEEMLDEQSERIEFLSRVCNTLQASIAHARRNNG